MPTVLQPDNNAGHIQINSVWYKFSTHYLRLQN